MAENNNKDNNKDNNNDNNKRGFIGGVLEYFTTPTRNRINRQNLIDQQLQQHRNQRQEAFNLEEELGIYAGVAALFPNNSESEEEEKEEEASEESKDQAPNIMPTTYTLGGMSVAFDTDVPTPNTDYEVGVVLSKENCPALGSDDERRLVEGIYKNQYEKYNRAESSMKSIERLLQSCGIMDTITATTTVLDRYDMKQPFKVIFPMDPTLQNVSLKMTFDGSVP
jgi:hypothetical protein